MNRNRANTSKSLATVKSTGLDAYAPLNYKFRQLELFAHKVANFNFENEYELSKKSSRNAGKFNHVILKYKNDENNTCCIFGYVKYRSKPATLEFESLVLNDSDFCLYKFFISIVKTLEDDSNIQNLFIITNIKMKRSDSNTLELKCGKMGLLALYLEKMSSNDIVFQNIGDRHKFLSSDIVRDTLRCHFIACELLNNFDKKKVVTSGILKGNWKFLQDNFRSRRYHKDYDWNNKNFRMLELALQLTFRKHFKMDNQTENNNENFWTKWESKKYDEKLSEILKKISIKSEAEMEQYKKIFDQQLDRFIDKLVFVTNLGTSQIESEIISDICINYNIDNANAELYYQTFEGKIRNFFSDRQEEKPFTLSVYKNIFKKIIPEFDSRFKNEYELVRGLGHGGFGVVYEVKHKLVNCNYAVKRIRMPKRVESKQRVLREVQVLAKCDHKNIVRYYDTWTERPPPGWQEERDKRIFREFFSKSVLLDSASTCSMIGKTMYGSEKSSLESNMEICLPSENTYHTFSMDISDCGDLKENFSTRKKQYKQREYLYITMELCEKDLKQWLDEKKLEARMEASNIFDQIIGAVHYIHMNGLIHRDLKPNNIFFDLSGNIKIGDFGLVTDDISEDCEDGFEMSQGVGTPFYTAPEIKGFGENNYNYKSDIYSLGIILFELLTSFGSGSERISVLTDLQNGKFPENFQRLFSKEFKLLKMMLSTNPDERPTTIGIMSRRASLSKHFNEQVDKKEYFFKLPPKEEREKFNSNLFKKHIYSQ